MYGDNSVDNSQTIEISSLVFCTSGRWKIKEEKKKKRKDEGGKKKTAKYSVKGEASQTKTKQKTIPFWEKFRGKI